MTLELFFSIEGDTQMIRRLNGISENMRDWSPSFQKTGRMLLKTFRDNFSTAGSMLGMPWAPLKPSTTAQKDRMGFSRNILIRTGTMKNAFVQMASKTDVIVWNPTSYFPFHQSNKPRQKLLRRVMMRLDEKRKQLIVKIFQNAVKDFLRLR